jgi:hypothetical protein
MSRKYNLSNMRLPKGAVIYLSLIILLILMILYVSYRQENAMISLDRLLTARSAYSFHRESPCFDDIYGEPNIAKKDNYVKINIKCPDGRQSTNTLLYDALTKDQTVYDVLVLVSEINNFSIGYKDGLVLGDSGNLNIKWKVSVNNVNRSSELETIKIKPKDIIEISNE